MIQISKKYSLLISLLFALVCSCDDAATEDPEPEVPPQINLPAKAISSLPVNGEPCSDYEEVANDDSKVSVLFRWNAAQFATGYELIVSDGSAEAVRLSVIGLETNVTLDRGQTYTWSVTAKNSDGDTNGDSNSFTTPGTPIGNFAPYTAEITITFDSGQSTMNISWVVSDEDGDSLSYDIIVLEDASEIINLVDLTTTSIAPINYMSDAEYLVEIISKDNNGNFSISKVTGTAPN